MTLGLLSLLIFVWIVMTVGAKRQARAVIEGRLNDLSKNVKRGSTDSEQYQKINNSSALVKARMLALVIQYDPEILNSPDRLKEMARTLNVDNIDISDGRGVVIASTEPGFLGYEMDSKAQSLPFMRMIAHRDYELVQAPQERGIDGVMVQYAGVARRDRPGIVQIAYTAENVSVDFDAKLMQETLRHLPIGGKGRFLVLKDEEGKEPVVFASGDPSENGCRLSELGFRYDPVLPDSVFLRGKPYFCQKVHVPGESKRVLALMPKSEVFGARNRAMLFILGIYLAFFVLFYFLLDHLIRRTVTDGFYEVNRTLDKIIAGDLTQTVNVRSNPEFLALSDGINTMVGGLKKNLTDSRRRVKRENELAKSIQQTLIPTRGDRTSVV